MNDTALHVFQPKEMIKEYKRRKMWLSICNIYEWEGIVDVRSGWTYFRNNVSGNLLKFQWILHVFVIHHWLI